MTNDDERRNAPPAGVGEDDLRLGRALRALARGGPNDEQFKAGLRERLLQHAQAATATENERTTTMATASAAIGRTGRDAYLLPRAHTRTRLSRLRILLAAALALAAGGSAAYLRLQPAEPVSAQSLLRHAMVALSAPSLGQAVHETSLLYYGPSSGFGTGSQTLAYGPITVTVDQWTQLTALGTIARQATTGRAPDSRLLFRVMQTGRTVRLYAPKTNTIETSAIPKGQSASWIDNPMGIADLRAFVRAVQSGAFPYVHLQKPTLLDGMAVNVVESRYPEPVPPGATARPAQDAYTLYLGARDDSVRGLDQVFIDSQGMARVITRMRMVRRDVVALSRIPAGTFSLHAPSSARVLPSQFWLPSVADAAARCGMPAPLLSTDVEGLQLQYIMAATLQGRDRFTYWYKAGTPILGQYDRRKTLIIEVFRYVPPVPGRSSVPTTPLTLRIAGSAVRARYYSTMTSNAGPTHDLSYHIGAWAISIQGSEMSRAQFFAAIGTLVDGHTHPGVIARLQRQIDAP